MPCSFTCVVEFISDITQNHTVRFTGRNLFPELCIPSRKSMSACINIMSVAAKNVILNITVCTKMAKNLSLNKIHSDMVLSNILNIVDRQKQTSTRLRNKSRERNMIQMQPILARKHIYPCNSWWHSCFLILYCFMIIFIKLTTLVLLHVSNP